VNSTFTSTEPTGGVIGFTVTESADRYRIVVIVTPVAPASADCW
jgi:hypothetical protein